MRISKFLSSWILSSNQRELVNFMKQYTLTTRVPKQGPLQGSMVIDTPGNETKRTPFEDLLEYKPSTNKVDGLLHKAILDEIEILDDESRQSVDADDELDYTVDDDKSMQRYFEQYYQQTQNVNAFLSVFKQEIE